MKKTKASRIRMCNTFCVPHMLLRRQPAPAPCSQKMSLSYFVLLSAILGAMVLALTVAVRADTAAAAADHDKSNTQHGAGVKGTQHLQQASHNSDTNNNFHSGIEHKGATKNKRFLRIQSECMTDLDCPAGTCCIPTVGRNRVRECRRLRDTNELCHPHSKPTPFSGFRGFPLCPCTAQLECNKQSWKCEINLLKK